RRSPVRHGCRPSCLSIRSYFDQHRESVWRASLAQVFTRLGSRRTWRILTQSGQRLRVSAVGQLCGNQIDGRYFKVGRPKMNNQLRVGSYIVHGELRSLSLRRQLLAAVDQEAAGCPSSPTSGFRASRQLLRDQLMDSAERLVASGRCSQEGRGREAELLESRRDRRQVVSSNHGSGAQGSAKIKIVSNAISVTDSGVGRIRDATDAILRLSSGLPRKVRKIMELGRGKLAFRGASTRGASTRGPAPEAPAAPAPEAATRGASTRGASTRRRQHQRRQHQSASRRQHQRRQHHSAAPEGQHRAEAPGRRTQRRQHRGASTRGASTRAPATRGASTRGASTRGASTRGASTRGASTAPAARSTRGARGRRTRGARSLSHSLSDTRRGFRQQFQILRVL
uniref:KRUF family protein n=1 Tax=Macrostomum lignano TaxID=282301 RepID=A0A1I8JL61_9PLAT